MTDASRTSTPTLSPPTSPSASSPSPLPTVPIPPPPPRRVIDGALRSVGKGVIQANLRLARVLEILETVAPATGAPAMPDTSAPLFDLLDALDAALAAPSWPPARRRLFGLLPPRPAPDDSVRSGLRVALDRAVEQLGQLGVRSVRASGPIDPRRHRVVGRVAAEEPARDGEIAAVRSRGWRMGDGDQERILRPACVDAWVCPRGETTP